MLLARTQCPLRSPLLLALNLPPPSCRCRAASSNPRRLAVKECTPCSWQRHYRPHGVHSLTLNATRHARGAAQPHRGIWCEPDNCNPHKNQDIIDLIEDTGARLRFLPTYSPDFNPIEKGFDIAKKWMKRHRNMAEAYPNPKLFT